MYVVIDMMENIMLILYHMEQVLNGIILIVRLHYRYSIWRIKVVDKLMVVREEHRGVVISSMRGLTMVRQLHMDIRQEARRLHITTMRGELGQVSAIPMLHQEMTGKCKPEHVIVI